MKKIIKYLDKPLLITTIILFIFGLIMIFSASNVVAYMSYNVSASHYFLKQALFLFVGFILFLIMIMVPTKTYKVLSWILLIIFSISLVILLIFIAPKNKAQSWFDLGPISIQPSEFIKVIIIVWLACFYESKQKKLNTYTTSLFPIFICLGIALLIFLQPDLGTTIIFCAIVAAIFFAVPISKEIKKRTVFLAVGLVAFAAVIFISTGSQLLQKRQLERFDFFKPCDKLLTTGNQVCNCYIAINNGGLTGTGLGNSTQKYLYLPEPYTDFIFAIVVEELGVLTGIALILTYIFIIYRILLIGRNSTTNRGATMCYGIAIYIFLHIAVNLLGIFGLMPMTGVPLPFMSYGGSFTICLIAALSIVQRVNIETGLAREKELR
ncbi:MAG: FtsW/RodA/SpoVE family cell cycle protein [bacterium]|nr:FtsW/RodA/SpoVE family cell cycle protein [bacterium]